MRSILAAICLALGVAGCVTLDAPESGAPDPAAVAGPEAIPAPVPVAAPPPTVDPSPATTVTLQEPDDVKYYRSDEPLSLGIEHFNRGHYGVAERYFRDAVEKAPRDVTAWVGLAASYDRLGRFDLADRAYRSATRLAGETVQILNNEGYSYMLRGDLVRARKKFLKAYEREPNNPMINNNLQLLNSSYKYVQRAP
jgi:Flp pilus assembly protein TadD